MKLIKQKEKQKIQVHRTTEGTIFEMAFAVLAVVVWVFVIWMICRAPDVIATHFDAHGRPNGYGSPWGLLVPSIIMTVAGIGLLVCAYYPHLINMPVEIKTTRQFELAIRMTRITALIMLLVTLAIPMTLLAFATPQPWPVLGTLALMLVVIIYYCVRIHRAKAS